MLAALNKELLIDITSGAFANADSSTQPPGTRIGKFVENREPYSFEYDTSLLKFHHN